MPMDTVKKLVGAEDAAYDAENKAKAAAEASVAAAKEEAERIVEKAKEDAAQMLKDAKARADGAAGKLKSEYDARLKKQADKLGGEDKGAKDKVIKIIMDELI